MRGPLRTPIDPTSGSTVRDVVRRGLLVAVAIGAIVAALALARQPDRVEPVAVVGHSQVLSPTTTLAPAAVPVPTPTPSPTPAPAAVAVAASRSSTVVESGSGRVSVTNEGSAVASTGGNTVVGPGSASVVNGPVSAVGNQSEVRVSRP